MTPCQKLQLQEGTTRRIESMQQSSVTPKTVDIKDGENHNLDDFYNNYILLAMFVATL